MTWAALGIAVLVAGCRGGADRPETVPVTGTVTYNGKPLSGANVVFTPEQGRPATGKTDENGQFKLTTFPDTANDGAIPGQHTVTVTLPADSQSQGKGELESAAAYADPRAKNNNSGPSIPVKYADPNQSPLTAEVTAEGKNNFTFELSDE